MRVDLIKLYTHVTTLEPYFEPFYSAHPLSQHQGLTVVVGRTED